MPKKDKTVRRGLNTVCVIFPATVYAHIITHTSVFASNQGGVEDE